MKRPSNLATLLLLAAAVAITQFLLWWLAPAPEPRHAAGPPRSGYMLENFELAVMGEDGRIDLHLRAPSLQRRDGDGSLFIDQPQFELLSQASSPWQGTSEFAWIAADGNEMRLRGNVELHRPADARTESADIRTAELAVWPGERRVATEAPTSITEPGRILHGTGMRADLDQHTLELLADVQGTFRTSRAH